MASKARASRFGLCKEMEVVLLLSLRGGVKVEA